MSVQYLIGTATAPGAADTREFLQRNGVAFQWVDVDRDPLVRLLGGDGALAALELTNGAAFRTRSAVVATGIYYRQLDRSTRATKNRSSARMRSSSSSAASRSQPASRDGCGATSAAF